MIISRLVKQLVGGNPQSVFCVNGILGKFTKTLTFENQSRSIVQVVKPLSGYNMDDDYTPDAAPAGAKENGVGKKAKAGNNKRLSVERIYQKKTQLEHILLRPDTYIGSVQPVTEKMWILDEVRLWQYLLKQVIKNHKCTINAHEVKQKAFICSKVPSLDQKIKTL